MTVEFRLESSKGEIISGCSASVSTTSYPDVGPATAYEFYRKNQIAYSVNSISLASGYSYKGSVSWYYEGYYSECAKHGSIPISGTATYSSSFQGLIVSMNDLGQYDYWYKGRYSCSYIIDRIVIVCSRSTPPVSTGEILCNSSSNIILCSSSTNQILCG